VNQFVKTLASSYEESSRHQSATDVMICFSHLRWDFVYQRPQHLMTRFAERQRVVFFEEPSACDDATARLSIRAIPDSGVVVATPCLPDGLEGEARQAVLRGFVDDILQDSARAVLWLYSPMFFPLVSHRESATIVYDCMDELSNFRFSNPELPALEQRLMQRADVMFTGGLGLYEAKRAFHSNIHPFPSSVDAAHFGSARDPGREPDDQAAIPHPRLGFYGVIDERMDLGLIAAVAAAHPLWHVVMIGPVVKIDPATLPRASNVHYLGAKGYGELPSYLRGWGATLMPFALNDATRFISPTKTLEYLAAGRPVVSTPVRDVVRSFGQLDAVRVASDPECFIAECAIALDMAHKPDRWMAEVDALLAKDSWQRTFERMAALLERVTAGHRSERIDNIPCSRPTTIPTWRPTTARVRADVLVVGAGFAGSVMAEQLATQCGKRVLVIDRRPHIGGNAYDMVDAAGVLMHKYGPHIFHTNSGEIFAYLSRFTKWRAYEHRVLARVGGIDVPMPINRTTLNRVYGLTLSSDAEAAAFMAARAEPVVPVRTSEDVVVSKVGRDLYDKIFRGYTRKQWGRDPSELDRSVAARVPARTNIDDRYFTDAYQYMPRDGYTRMFENMLDHELIEVQTNVEYKDMVEENVFDHVVFTGPIDEFFDFRLGTLPYRSLRFQHITLEQERFQPVGTVNYPDEEVPYTRITEYKHLTGQAHAKTTLTYEHPSADGDPYYPVPRPENQVLFKQYEILARTCADVTFVGRLATYRYYNMDQVIGQALSASKALGRRWGTTARESAAATPLLVAGE